MNHAIIARLFVMFLACGFTGPLRGNEGTVGEKVLSSNGQRASATAVYEEKVLETFDKDRGDWTSLKGTAKQPVWTFFCTI